MSDPNPAAAPKPKGNPALEMMGLPKLRAKLPSKPWLVFFGLVGTWTAFLTYDRREKRRVQRQWCDRVRHLADIPMSPMAIPRRVTVYLSAPPGDGIGPAREYFREYVKPVLNAGALDYEVVEGRRAGEIRWKVAERIRRVRRGEGDGEGGKAEIMEKEGRKVGTHDEGSINGVMVLGRHTWKEYVRGLHEGWLGPDDLPLTPEEQAVVDGKLPVQSLDAAAATDATKTEEEKKKKQNAIPPPAIMPAEYSAASLAPVAPSEFQPSSPIPLPNLLGFLNFPFRIHRYLTQRRLADSVGRDVAAVVLGEYSSVTSEDVKSALMIEEPDWPKKFRKAAEVDESLEEKNDDGSPKKPADERKLWAEAMTLDSRILERMRRFALDKDQNPSNELD